MAPSLACWMVGVVWRGQLEAVATVTVLARLGVGDADTLETADYAALPLQFPGGSRSVTIF